MKLKKITRLSSRTKLLSRHRTLTVVIAAIILVGIFAWWSKYNWDTYQTNYQGWRSSAIGQTRDALALPASSDQERQAKFAALERTSGNIEAAKKSLCTITGWVGWQRFIESLRTREQQCQEIVNRFATFNEKLRPTLQYLEQAQALARAMREAPSQPELAEADWIDVATRWHVVVEKIGSLPADGNFTPTKQAARDVVGKIDTAWQVLLAAHSAKDRAQYNQAKAQLVQTYSTLATVTDVNAGQLKTLTDLLQTAYGDLLKL